MEIRSLPRHDFLQTAGALRQANPALAKRVGEDESLFEQVPGDTLGAMSDHAFRLWKEEQRSSRSWSWGAAALVGVGGIASLYTLQFQPLNGLALGVVTAAGTALAMRGMNRHKAEADRFLESALRLGTWERVLEEAERRARELEHVSRSEVDRLARGLEHTGSALLETDRGLLVGGVRLKTRPR